MAVNYGDLADDVVVNSGDMFDVMAVNYADIYADIAVNGWHGRLMCWWRGYWRLMLGLKKNRFARIWTHRKTMDTYNWDQTS